MRSSANFSPVSRRWNSVPLRSHARVSHWDALNSLTDPNSAGLDDKVVLHIEVSPRLILVAILVLINSADSIIGIVSRF